MDHSVSQNLNTTIRSTFQAFDDLTFYFAVIETSKTKLSSRRDDFQSAPAREVKLAMEYCSTPSGSFPFLDDGHSARHSFGRRLFRRKCDVNKQTSSRHRLPI